jgi:hypothetical protein
MNLEVIRRVVQGLIYRVENSNRQRRLGKGENMMVVKRFTT